MLLCLNLVLSKWVMWHDTFWGRLQNRKNRRNEDGRLVLEVTYFIVIWQKGGNELLKIGNWKYQNFEWLRKTLISIFLSPPNPVQGWKKKYCSFSSERRWLTTRILFWWCSYLLWLQSSCTVWGHVLLKQRQIVTDLSVAITDRAGATESTFENYCVLTKSFLGKETTI